MLLSELDEMWERVSRANSAIADRAGENSSVLGFIELIEKHVMESQLSIFRAYLEKHPVTQSYSLINRARECWRLHKAEWDKAAKSGEGYSCYKALSSAV